MTEGEKEIAPSLGVKLSDLFDRAEAVYLRVLRFTILVIATLLILYTLYLALSGLYGITRSPSSVREAVANVTANEIVDAEEVLPKDAPGAKGPVVDPAQQKFYADFVARYYKLFRTKFEPFRQPEDKTLSRDEFDDYFVQSGARLRAVTAGEVNFASDSADLEALLATMMAATADPKGQQRLQRYKAARKVRVESKVQKTRTETRDGWDVYSTSCPYWYESPRGCPVQRTVDVPYTETVVSMEFPEGTQSHAQIFRAMQDRFYALLQQKRRDNADDADARRMRIAAGNVRGAESLATALRIFAGFLALMFFFLLIAIERHQRRIATALPRETDVPPDPEPIAQSPRPRARRASPAR